METSQVVLNNGLAFLAVATGIMVIIAGGFLVKLLMDLSKLSKNLDESTTIIKEEVKPVLKELNSTLKSINSIAQNADKKVDSLSKILENIFGAGSMALSKAKTFSGGLLKGLTQGIVVIAKMFMKK